MLRRTAKNMRPNVDPQKIERLMQALGREAKGSGYIYFTGGEACPTDWMA